MSVSTDLAIIGGGLSGMALADHAQRAGLDWQLLEARSRLGGRALSVPLGPDNARYDLGPAWLWPGDTRAIALANRLGRQVFGQHAAGCLVFEDETGAIRRDLDFATMDGALRVAGGIVSLVDGIAETLPSARLRLGAEVTGLAQVGANWRLTLADGSMVDARRIAFAAPPRVIAQRITLPAEIGPESQHALRAVPTWMAGQAKVIAVYDRPFWREAGLSGDAISRRGPLVEVHDASPADGGAGALFGFVGVPPAARAGHGTALEEAALAQLGALFGAAAAKPAAVRLADWAEAAFTTTSADLGALGAHPSGGIPTPLAGLATRGLVFAGAEVSTTHPGVIEGALQAAEAAFAQITAGPTVGFDPAAAVLG